MSAKYSSQRHLEEWLSKCPPKRADVAAAIAHVSKKLKGVKPVTARDVRKALKDMDCGPYWDFAYHAATHVNEVAAQQQAVCAYLNKVVIPETQAQIDKWWATVGDAGETTINLYLTHTSGVVLAVRGPAVVVNWGHRPGREGDVLALDDHHKVRVVVIDPRGRPVPQKPLQEIAGIAEKLSLVSVGKPPKTWLYLMFNMVGIDRPRLEATLYEEF
jgi:hypothetical protein